MIKDNLEWTGERLVTSIKGIGIIEHLHRYAIACEFVHDKIVLDIASGEGYGSNLLAKNAKKVTGVDISEEAVSFASNKYKRANLIFKLGSVTNIPVESNCVDVVISFETLEHVTEHEIMLKEIKRVLKSDGLLIISSPERSNYGDVNETKNPFHVKELYFAQFEELLKAHFRNFCYLFQKSSFGSLIVPQALYINNFSEYNGDFENINSFNNLQLPIFNLCLASEGNVPKVNVSYFDSKEHYDLRIIELQNQIKSIIDSKLFKLVIFLSYPLIKIKRWLFK
jgi:ubiquinone/menaquinone biosynthesis C-methylase UbiE